MRTTKTIRSIHNSLHVYAEAGEEVKLISANECVMIVEGVNGRFPVTADEVTEDENIIVKEKIINNPVPPKRKTKNQKVAPQNLMF